MSMHAHRTRISLANSFGDNPVASQKRLRSCRSLKPASLARVLTLALPCERSRCVAVKQTAGSIAGARAAKTVNAAANAENASAAVSVAASSRDISRAISGNNGSSGSTRFRKAAAVIPSNGPEAPGRSRAPQNASPGSTGTCSAVVRGPTILTSRSGPFPFRMSTTETVPSGTTACSNAATPQGTEKLQKHATKSHNAAGGANSSYTGAFRNRSSLRPWPFPDGEACTHFDRRAVFRRRGTSVPQFSNAISRATWCLDQPHGLHHPRQRSNQPNCIVIRIGCQSVVVLSYSKDSRNRPALKVAITPSEAPTTLRRSERLNPFTVPLSKLHPVEWKARAESQAQSQCQSWRPASPARK